MDPKLTDQEQEVTDNQSREATRDRNPPSSQSIFERTSGSGLSETFEVKETARAQCSTNLKGSGRRSRSQQEQQNIIKTIPADSSILQLTSDAISVGTEVAAQLGIEPGAILWLAEWSKFINFYRQSRAKPIPGGEILLCWRRWCLRWPEYQPIFRHGYHNRTPNKTQDCIKATRRILQNEGVRKGNE
jgi:hypothetical protein